MSDAKVKFFKDDEDWSVAEPGKEQMFEFTCPHPKGNGRKCGFLIIAGKTEMKRDPQNGNGGVAQWDWDGNRETPTFSPSIDCKGCWHGYIRKGRCVTAQGKDEPEPTCQI